MISEPSHLFIALLRAESICAQDKWPNGIALCYDPGAVSVYTGETLSYCFLENEHNILGGTSVGVYSSQHANLSSTLAAQAIRELDRERSWREANLPAGWLGRVRPEVQATAQKLYRLYYVLPEDEFLSSVYRHLEERGSLSEKQIAAVERNYQERGGHKELRRLHHTLWRLHRLAEIDLAPKDAETVAGLQRDAQSRYGLNKKRLPVITVIEDRYGNQRLEATRLRAARIVEWLHETQNQE